MYNKSYTQQWKLYFYIEQMMEPDLQKNIDDFNKNHGDLDLPQKRNPILPWQMYFLMLK